MANSVYLQQKLERLRRGLDEIEFENQYIKLWRHTNVNEQDGSGRDRQSYSGWVQGKVST
jgi:hypothetical protein